MGEAIVERRALSECPVGRLSCGDVVNALEAGRSSREILDLAGCCKDCPAYRASSDGAWLGSGDSRYVRMGGDCGFCVPGWNEALGLGPVCRIKECVDTLGMIYRGDGASIARTP
ncbi:MAG: hypothetical protein JW727_06420 [Candidatus Aenigmarchaeota archaeon]|nr:hypothetical protein [Candidatus Aenigmarchaeota archaeon]